MKLAKLLLFIIVIVIFANVYMVNVRQPNKQKTEVKNIEPSPKVIVNKPDTIDTLIDKMIEVESTGNDSAVNHRTNAVGCLQIRPIMLKDVNRILGENRYTLDDRLSRVKSIEIFHIWRNHYHKRSSLEKIARCWNGGGRGHLMNATKRYWDKIKSL